MDQWGDPFAYFSARKYEDPAAVAKVRMADGRIALARPHRDPETGLPLHPGKYQLFSAGPDGEFNTEDDLGNW